MSITEGFNSAVDTLKRIKDIGYRAQVLEDRRLARLLNAGDEVHMLPQTMHRETERYRKKVAGWNPVKLFLYDVGANKARAIEFGEYLQYAQQKYA